MQRNRALGPGPGMSPHRHSLVALAFLLSTAALQSAETKNVAVLRALGDRPPVFLGANPQPPALPRATPFPSPALDEEASFLVGLIRSRTASDTLLTLDENTAAVAHLLDLARCGATERPFTRRLTLNAVNDALILGARAQLGAPYPLPSEVRPALGIPVPGAAFSGFPSLHAINTTLVRLILELCAQREFPEVRAYADRIARRRMIAGAEWPNAIAGGEIYAYSVLFVLQRRPKFDEQLQLARKEWTVFPAAAKRP